MPEDSPYDDEVTPARALMLAEHAHYVQGGFSTPENEARRIRADIERGAVVDWEQKSRELEAARKAAATAPVSEFDGTLDVALLRRYKQLREAQKTADAEGKAMKEEADKLEGQLVEMFSEAGVQNANLDGKTIYLHRSVYAKRLEGADDEVVQAALIEAGAGDLIKPTVNGQTLSAWVRELTEDDDAPGLPEAVVGILEPGERFSVRIIAGGSKAKSKTHSK